MVKSLADYMQAALVSSRGIWKVAAILALCLLVGTLGGAVLAFLSLPYTAALVVALVGAALLLSDTKWGLYALIGVACLLPFAAVPLDIGFEPTFLDLVLLSLLFVLATRIAKRRQGPLVATPLALPILLFMIIAVVAMLASLSHSSLTSTLIRRFAELMLAVFTFFIVVNTVKTQQRLEQLVRLLILAGFAAAFIGLVLYFLPETLTIRLLSALRVVRYPAGSDVLRYVEDDPSLALRATSTSQDPNVLGGLLILVTGITIPQIMSKRPLLPRWMTLPMAACMLACLVLTYSRGAMAGLAIGIAAISVLRYHRLGWLLLIGAALILLLPPMQEYVEHFVEGVRGEDLATQMRLGEYSDAFKLIMRHPWLGVGFSSTPEIDLYVGVSCVYLLIAEEMGLIGLGVFLLAIALFFILFWRHRHLARLDERLEAIFWGIGCALIGGLAAGVVDHYFFNLSFPHAATLFWTYIGLGMVTMSLLQRQGAREQGGSSMVTLPTGENRASVA